MKSCPTCNRTFEDTFTFCLIDGSILSAPFDPNAAKPQPGSAEPPPTEVISSAPATFTARAETPKDLQSTIAAPFTPQPQQPQPHFAPAATSQPTPKLDLVRWVFVVRGVLAILFGILLLFGRLE